MTWGVNQAPAAAFDPPKGHPAAPQQAVVGVDVIERARPADGHYGRVLAQEETDLPVVAVSDLANDMSLKREARVEVHRAQEMGFQGGLGPDRRVSLAEHKGRIMSERGRIA